MNMRKTWFAALCLGGLLFVGCDKPCQTTSECGGGEVCAGAICQTLSCETAFLARDPKSGACTALSGCFLTEEQRAWSTCADDPCRGQAENSCVTDARCQPAYSNPKIDLTANKGAIDVACGGAFPTPGLPPDPDGKSVAPGVNNGEAKKHPSTLSQTCFPNSARAYAGCRAVPQIAKRVACTSLTAAACAGRPDCTTGQEGGGVFDRDAPPRTTIPVDSQIAAECFDRVSISETCEGADAQSCLLSQKCQPIGSRCYCPPGGACSCDEGAFLGCEINDRLRRCTSAAECGADERCDRDEACIQPRTFDSPPGATDPVPGTGSCLGACVKMGCTGYGEKACHERPECDAGSYGTVCRPKPYCRSDRMDPPAPGPTDPTDPSAPVEGSSCGCETEFLGCQPVIVQDGLRPEHSLLVRDPEIVSDPAFRIDNVLRRLAPAGQGDEFVRVWFQRLGQGKTLPNGAAAQPRRGAMDFYAESAARGSLTLAALATQMHTTSLVNRIDLAGPGDCGEARLTFAMNSGYDNGNQRMTLIAELRVPDDGAGCRTVAQRWGELSLIDDVTTRRERLVQIFDPLLTPARIGQLRTNEFLNRFGSEAWELREWKLGADGMPELAPVKQTLGPEFAGRPALLTWARQNAAALKAGTAVIPAEFLAAASTENGARLALAGSSTDVALKDAEKGLNALSCAGCHLTETRSPFAHVGERLGRRAGLSYVPAGRAVIDAFLKKDIEARTTYLRTLLSVPQMALAGSSWRQVRPARVH